MCISKSKRLCRNEIPRQSRDVRKTEIRPRNSCTHNPCKWSEMRKRRSCTHTFTQMQRMSETENGKTDFMFIFAAWKLKRRYAYDQSEWHWWCIENRMLTINPISSQSNEMHLNDGERPKRPQYSVREQHNKWQQTTKRKMQSSECTSFGRRRNVCKLFNNQHKSNLILFNCVCHRNRWLDSRWKIECILCLSGMTIIAHLVVTQAILLHSTWVISWQPSVTKWNRNYDFHPIFDEMLDELNENSTHCI